MVEQNIKSGLRWKARIQTDMFEQLFERRVRDDSIKVAKALEANFYEPQTPQEERIKHSIDVFHARKATEYEAEVFKQKKRLADAARSMKMKVTKRALEEQRVATNKIEWNLKRIDDLKRQSLVPHDSRIFPFWYAPVMVMEDDQLVITPMRYHCRLNGKPPSYDTRYPGLYNARRDNLEKFWKGVFGHRHAIAIVTSFFENVALHDFERRALRVGEKESNVVLHFNPRPATPMLLACVWDRWQEKDQTDLYSFALITDDPPAEIAATGHNRCPIPLNPSNIKTWLTPEKCDIASLQRLLDNRERPYYEHQRAA